ncbi:hypothetical protein WMW72_18520 [Paenibacillus filicis]|uniref:Uncharacterized protein n=1 Tax=Paenibacillus filicis TaxID=669464 RepID=A0ABU9DNW0_9BACL
MRKYKAFYFASENSVFLLMIYQNENSIDIHGELLVNELLFEKRPFIDEVPTIHSTTHPFIGEVYNKEIDIKFTGEAKSLNPDWKDPLTGLFWKGIWEDDKIIFLNSTFPDVKNMPFLLTEDEKYFLSCWLN